MSVKKNKKEEKVKKSIPQPVVVVGIVGVSLALATGIIMGSDKLLENRLNKFEAKINKIETFCIEESVNEKLDAYLIPEKLKTSEIKERVAETKLKEFEEELILNNETVDSVFYKLDMEKIDKKLKNTNMYMSMQTSKVYNIDGIEAYGNKFFSITPKIEKARVNNKKITKEDKKELENKDGFFVEKNENGKITIVMQEYINTNEKLEMQVVDYLGKTYKEDVTNLVKNGEFVVMPKGTITKEAITNPNKVSFIFTKRGKVLKQDLSIENTKQINYNFPIISLIDIQNLENGKVIYLDAEKEMEYYYIETKVTDAFGNRAELVKIKEDEKLFADEIIKTGRKADGKNIRVDKNICSLSIVGVDSVGTISNILNLENIDMLY